MIDEGSTGNAERSGYQGLFHEKEDLTPGSTKTGIAAKRKKKLAKPGRDEHREIGMAAFLPIVTTRRSYGPNVVVVTWC
jgi:hypothetical protein